MSKTAFDYLKENGIVRQGENDIEVVSTINYYGLVHAMSAYASLKVEEAKESQWISVKTRLPERHQNVWCYNSDGRQFKGRICYGMHEPFFTFPDGDGDASNTCPRWIDVTHWLSIPHHH